MIEIGFIMHLLFEKGLLDNWLRIICQEVTCMLICVFCYDRVLHIIFYVERGSSADSGQLWFVVFRRLSLFFTGIGDKQRLILVTRSYWSGTIEKLARSLYPVSSCSCSESGGGGERLSFVHESTRLYPATLLGLKWDGMLRISFTSLIHRSTASINAMSSIVQALARFASQSLAYC